MSPMLFNVYLEEALNTSQKLKDMRSRGDLLAFADDMLILTDSKAEMEEAIKELSKLEARWNLKLNKKKSQVITKDTTPDIEGVPCMQQVKYLGVPIHTNPKQ
jgi:Reverse transcriptase (RNA-dependent DNA polymerase)